MSPRVGESTRASSRATVLLPLPLSPTRATISRSRMVRSNSSTACRVCLENNPPRPKWRVRSTARRSGWLSAAGPSRASRVAATPSVGIVGRLGIEEAAYPGTVNLVELGLALGTYGHDLGATWVEATPAGRPGEIRR